MHTLHKIPVAFAVVLSVFVMTFSQMHGQNPNDTIGMQGRCPMCGRQWNGSNYYTPTIPDSIPAPKNKEWLKKLDDIMGIERLSKAQYQKDEQKYNLHMPYAMIIPQEEDHIEWITKLYNAFRLKAPETVPPIKETNSLKNALEVGMQLEKDLIPQYEWLVKNAENDIVKTIIGDILYQTRMHYTMFQHALNMGSMMR